MTGSRYSPERHGPHRVVGPGFHELVYRCVQGVPRGRVTTYGDVAAALGRRGVARQVGYALAALPDTRDDVPWHRVVAARGQVSLRGDGRPSPRQVALLRGEGVAVGDSGRVEDFAGRRHRFSCELS